MKFETKLQNSHSYHRKQLVIHCHTTHPYSGSPQTRNKKATSTWNITTNTDKLDLTHIIRIRIWSHVWNKENQAAITGSQSRSA